MKKRICSFILVLLIVMNLCVPVSATEYGVSVVQELIGFINTSNISGYIALFDESNQQLMNDFVTYNGTEDFFQEEHIELLNIKRLTNTTGILAANVSVSEQERYDSIVVIYTKEYVTAKQSSNRVSGGNRYNLYVLGCENETYEVLRIAQPSSNIINMAGENFPGEEVALTASVSSRLLITLPARICVYFHKSENRTYHGATRQMIPFDTYLKNVIPCEWIVSYYSSYPAYLTAGALASKMYAWYYHINPKWNFSPYYADVVDNGNDQNYLATAYENLGATS